MPRRSIDPVEAAFNSAVGTKQAARELTDGAIRCSVPGCGGIVKKDFVLSQFGPTPIGLCAQKETHQMLGALDAKAKETVGRLLTLYRFARARAAAGN